MWVLQVVDGALPPSTSDEIRKFAKETVALALKEWNDKNGTVDANVRLCLGKDATKETVPNVAVEKVLLKLIYGPVSSCEQSR